MFLCGCTHYTISDHTYLKPIDSGVVKKSDLQVFPMNLQAAMDCYEDGRMRRCSNKDRIDGVVDILNQRGYAPVKPRTGETAPMLSVQVEELDPVGNFLYMAANLFSFGLIPRHNYRKYKVNYTDKEKSINLYDEVKVDISSGWIPMFRFNSEHLSGQEINKRAEWNVINSVFDKADLVKKENITAN